MTIASGHIQNKGKVRYPDFEHGCTGLASSNLRMKPEETVIGNTYRYYFGNGYVKFSDGFAALNPQYFFYTKDHLGNIRSVATKTNGVVEEVQHTAYYPFGGIISDLSTGRDVQNHLYNGKELDTSNNLYWYDYGARQYDPTAPRFTTPDPLAEKFYPWNYFTYCTNNPVNAIDPDGRNPLKVIVKGAYKIAKTAIKQGGSAFLKGTTYAEAFNDVASDAQTILDSSASTEDKIMAGISLASEIASPISIKDVKNIKDATQALSHNINPKKLARQQAKEIRDQQPASERYVKYKAKELEKKEGKDARRKAHDEKKQGESDRSKIQIDEDYKIKNNNYDKNRNIENSNI